METVVHDGRKTAYRETGADGDGPTMLYVHGCGGNHRVWVHQYAPQGPSHPAVVLDLSGHGESEDVDTGAGPETLAAYAEDVVAVARATGADVLVGNSLGGAVLFEVLLEREFDPAGVVFAGTGAKLAVHESIRRLLREDFEGVVERLHRPSYLLADPEGELLERSKEALRAAGQRVTRRDFLTCHEFDVRDRLGDITTPALAVVGDADQLTPPDYHEYLAEAMPNCELSLVEDAAHLAMLERPDAFNSVLESSVTGLDP
jgi:pimeloyl-ACP methyl ester carboxylesterase